MVDHANADVRRRISDFVRQGFGFIIYSLASPNEHMMTTIAADRALIV